MYHITIIIISYKEIEGNSITISESMLSLICIENVCVAAWIHYHMLFRHDDIMHPRWAHAAAKNLLWSIIIRK